ncbi:DegT/DnrJ/EryC1/StrS family aminotransferase [Roseomonas sp. OT10]|uniref:DegT/DnrJ/EryC1/StrS family aminotransferase n=1 Tax=Roseomonas cutis TaxID=2897332 RepID=UPI001E63015E|nr:aminotransferase class I/II-fold pyridoxal phosphate-dependent enzyme [Roseomonas sp. OT10]UFN50495.1 DegT/DnrJ/EryC1/StrS family aminotransferase [Roseomonas sp. OT10]
MRGIPQGSADSTVVAFPAGAPACPPAAPQLSRLYLSPPQLGGGEFEALRQTLESGWIAPAGPVPRAFEAALAAATGFGHVLGVSSGTAALHLGYRVLDLAPGDAVWTSTLTFVATVAPAVQMGAAVTFLDVSPESWTLDPELLREALGRAARRGRLPRVVVPVDLYGQCSDLEAIQAVCDRWGVPVLCDSAEALGASQRGQPAGYGARLAAFSFNGNKIVTAGGGGALASDDARLIERARHLAGQAKEASPHYQHETTGYSYALSSVLAAIGMAQLSRLEERVAQRRATFARYVEALSDLPGVSFMPEPCWGQSSRWLSVALFDAALCGADRETVRRALDAEGIESRPVWKPLHLQPAFRGSVFVGGGVAAGLFERGLCLPSGAMPPGEQDRVIQAIRRCLCPGGRRSGAGR